MRDNMTACRYYLGVLVASLAASCASKPTAPLPYVGPKTVVIYGADCCGLHRRPLARTIVFGPPPSIVVDQSEEYAAYHAAFPNHRPQSLYWIPIYNQNVQTEIMLCLECEIALERAMKHFPVVGYRAAKK